MVSLKYFEVNRTAWDQMIPLLLVERAKRREQVCRGNLVLASHELEMLPLLKGLDVFCPFCGTGEEVVSLALNGARVTASDISQSACVATEVLAKTANMSVCTELGESIESFERQATSSFDLVYISRGVLPWICDLSLFFSHVARVLRFGGHFFCFDGHPVSELVDSHTHDEATKPRSYADHCLQRVGLWLSETSHLEDARNYQWFHSLSAVLNAAQSVGLDLLRIEEHPFHFYQHDAELTFKDGLFWPKNERGCCVPLSVSLLMTSTERKESTIHYVPGPVPVANHVRRPLAMQVEVDEGQEFEVAYCKALNLCCGLFGANVDSTDIVICPGGGHAINEAALRTCRSLADSAVAVVNGFWGERLACIAEAIGINVTRINGNPGEDVSLSKLDGIVGRCKPKLLLGVMVETSTGMKNPIDKWSEIARRYGCLLMVDGVSAIGGYTDDSIQCGIDIMTTVSGKAIGAPPGLAIAFLSKRIQSLSLGKTRDTVYWNLPHWLGFTEGRRNVIGTFYPNILHSLNNALVDLGLPKRSKFSRLTAELRTSATSFRRTLRSGGYIILPHEDAAASTVTALSLPSDQTKLLLRFLVQNGTRAGGSIIESLPGIVRIGHMGLASKPPAFATVANLLSEFRSVLTHNNQRGRK